MSSVGALVLWSASLAACQVVAPPSYLDGASPDEILERMLQLATPGPEHAALNALVGTFDAQVTSWTGPYDEPTRSTGAMVNTWILGGRCLRGEFTGELLGQPFEGLSLLGFDRSQGKYFGTWADTASTWFMPFSSGTMTGNILTLERDMYDPTMGAMTHIREAFVVESPDRYRYVMYYSLPDGSEAKSMETVYTRARAVTAPAP